MQLIGLTDEEFVAALNLVDRYRSLRLDIVDASVMAIADARGAFVLTWDFRDFRAAVTPAGSAFDLFVQESELPGTNAQ
jgi:predicted nucleic acid-binding protein